MAILVECRYCGKTFRTFKCKIRDGKGKYCSKKCYHDATRTQQKIVCEFCGKEFLAYQCKIKLGRKYCSNRCQYNARIKDDIEAKCAFCGKTFYYSSKYRKHPHKYCSISCFAHASMPGRKQPESCRLKLRILKMGHTVSKETRDKISKAKQGEKSSTWRGGTSFEPYCPKFNKTFKRHVRDVFNHKCFICGSDDGGRKHAIHHIDYNKNAICNGHSWALIPLCKSCHSKTNFNRYYWFNLLISYWLINPEISLEVYPFSFL